MNLYSKLLILRWFFGGVWYHTLGDDEAHHVTSIHRRLISRSLTPLRTKKIIAEVKILNKGLCLKEIIPLKKIIYVTSTSFNNNNSNFYFHLAGLRQIKLWTLWNSSRFFYQRIYGTNFKRIDICRQCQIDDFDHDYQSNYQKNLKIGMHLFLWPSITYTVRKKLIEAERSWPMRYLFTANEIIYLTQWYF